MSSLGVFEVDLWIKGKKFTHPVNVVNDLNEKIIRIDFIHAHKLTCDKLSRQVKFASAYANIIAALKQIILPTMTSIVINMKYKGKADPKSTYVANICAPRTPMVSGMPSIVSVDKFNNCKILFKIVHPMMPHLQ